MIEKDPQTKNVPQRATGARTAIGPRSVIATAILVTAILSDMRSPFSVSTLFLSKAFAETPTESALDKSLRALQSDDPAERMRGAAELRNLPPPTKDRQEAQKSVLKALREHSVQDERFIGVLVQVLDAWGVNTSSVLVRAILDGDETLSFGVARTLREVGPSRVQSLSAELAPLAENAHSRGRLGAVETIGILGLKDPAALAALHRAASDRDQRLRFRALTALKRIGDASPGTIEIYTAALNDPSSTVSSRAVNALTALGPHAKTALPALEELRGRATGSMAKELDVAIRAIGKDSPHLIAAAIPPADAHVEGPEVGAAVPQVERVLPNPTSQLPVPELIARQLAMPEAPKQEKSDEHADADTDQRSNDMRASLRRDIPAESVRAPRAIVEISLDEVNSIAKGDRQALAQLIRGLESRDSEVRATAAMKIPELQIFEAELVPPLGAAVRDSDPKVRFAAGYALGKFGAAAIDPLSAASKDDNVLVRLNAVQAMESLLAANPAVFQLLETCLKEDKDPSVQIQAAMGILSIYHSHAPAIQTLVNQLPNAGAQLRTRMILSLRSAGKEIVFTKLGEAAKNEDKQVRREALASLVDIAPNDAVTKRVLKSQLDDGDEEVRRSALATAKQLEAETQ